MTERKKLKIILIDDNPDYLFTMETFLQRNGFETLTAADGKTGLELIRAERPDVILLDVMMETLFSGFEVCREVRSDPELAHTPIIGISGMGDELDVKFDKYKDREYFNPEEFMEKPVDKDVLLNKIVEVVEKANARR